MTSIYTKPLMTLVILLVLITGLLYLQINLQENFISDQTFSSQKNFINNNIAKAKIGDAAIDISHPPAPEPVKKAIEDIDLFAKRERPATENWYTNVFDSAIYKKEQECRKIELPENLPNDAVKQRIDCAWMFNPTGRSGSTLCSIAGPIFPASRRKYPTNQYTLTWSKAEAIKKERIKECALTKKCDLLIPGKGCGFCPEMGRAIPVDAAGNSSYGEARCPGPPVTEPSMCRRPRSEGGGGYDSLTCDPDSEGRLSKACLTALAEQASCSDGGTLLQALKDSSNPEISSKQVREVADVMRSYSFSIPDSLLKDGKIVVDTALNTYINISKAAQTAASARVRRAAGNLCSGTPFHPCEYEDDSKENFNLRCLQDLYQQVGCQGRGTDFPNSTNLSSFFGKTWGNVKKAVNELSDKMVNQNGRYTAEEQKDAVRRCIGTRLRKRSIGYCNEFGIVIYMYYGGKYGTFFGRKILTNQFFSLKSDSTFWDSLDIFNSQFTGGQTVYLVIKTNINPETNSTLSYTRTGNFNDVIRWNDRPMVSKNGTGIAQDPVNGLIVVPNQQRNQRLEIEMSLPYTQHTQRYGMWYMADNAGNSPPITICRLPIERKNPMMNIVMNAGNVEEITGNVGISHNGCREGNLGGESCTIFDGGSTFIRIGNGLRNRAFRSYTMKVWCDNLENRDSFFSFYNGKWEQRNEIKFWIFIPLGLFFWIPIPIFHIVWRYDGDNWWKSSNRIGMSTGPYNDSIKASVKPNQDQGETISAEQSGIIKPKTWQHFTWIWNGDFTQIDIYVDGVKKASGTGAAMPEGITGENYIGRAALDGTHRLHKGGMMWFRGFDYALSPDEIQQDMDDDW
jgi:hypothetical protein